MSSGDWGTWEGKHGARASVWFRSCKGAQQLSEECCARSGMLLCTGSHGPCHPVLCRCGQEDLDRERGAVLEEWRSGRGASGRAAEAHWKLLMKDNKVCSIDGLGTCSSLCAALRAAGQGRGTLELLIGDIKGCLSLVGAPDIFWRQQRPS